jgi:tetratricopeptide (TPR) repeat protein
MAEEADKLKQQANKLFKGTARIRHCCSVTKWQRRPISLPANPILGCCVICTHTNLPLCPVAEKHYAAAVHLYTQAIDIQPDNAVLYANRAFAHIKIEEYGSAVMDASKAIEANPTYAKVQQQIEAAQLRRFRRDWVQLTGHCLHVAVVGAAAVVTRAFLSSRRVLVCWCQLD